VILNPESKVEVENRPCRSRIVSIEKARNQNPNNSKPQQRPTKSKTAPINTPQ
jgi:hypothetical protein